METDKLGRVRLIGVDTPEQGRCYENAATRFTRERIGGKTVRYELGVERKDRYSRTLAYLFLRGEMHNLALLREGYATVLTIRPNDKYALRFERTERYAQRQDVGRWSTCESRASRVPRAGPTARPAPKPNPAPATGPSLPDPPPDLDCSDVSGPVVVGPDDPHGLDGNGDGVGCE